MSVNALYREMRERVLQEAQRLFCRAAGLPYYHIVRTDMGKGQKGFPDTVVVAGRTVWFIENKRETGRLADEQKAWGEALQRVTAVKYRLVRPSTWEATRDEILRDVEAA